MTTTVDYEQLGREIQALDFDVCFSIRNGHAVETREQFAPTVYETEQGDGTWEPEIDGRGWEFVSDGMTGQYSYSGPLMHSSEFIGAGIAWALDEMSGDYLAFAVVYALPLTLDGDDEDADIESWAIVGYAPKTGDAR